MAFDSVLVANRGEIACRILRSARALGLRSIAVFSEVDRDAPHVGLADEAVPIGPAPVGDSYLNAGRILKAAKRTGAASVHPGYGFLSENHDFAKAVADAGLVFIGPPAKTIRLMGDKAEARRLMKTAGVPCIPGYEGDDQSDTALIEAAGQIGFPVMIKAAAGGGGRGMRLVPTAEGLAAALPLVRAEAMGAFGADRLIVEKAVADARHVEVQIFADNHGHCIHLGERDCSVQRRHQKVVEEAPSPAVTPDLRDRIGRAAVTAAMTVGYSGAGTVEFLLDSAGEFYFLEMNTRLQVEHPVTEMVTGLDLVAMQISVAQGDVLPMVQEDVRFDGHAIEARLYAEDPARDFLPVTGRIDFWRPAKGEGVRIDDGIAGGQDVPPFYDPMLAKIVAWGRTREVARRRLVRAIEDTVLLGVTTNTGFLTELLQTDGFVQNRVTTGFVDDTWRDGVSAASPPMEDVALAVALLLQSDQQTSLHRGSYLTSSLLGWSSAAPLQVPVRLVCDTKSFDVFATCAGPDWAVAIGDECFVVAIDSFGRALINDRSVEFAAAVSPRGDLGLAVGGGRWSFRRVAENAGDDALTGGGRVLAPMPGLVIDIHVSVGQEVKKGHILAVLEAMKMQHRIVAPVDGTVKQVAIAADERLASGDPMFDIEEAGS